MAVKETIYIYTSKCFLEKKKITLKHMPVFPSLKKKVRWGIRRKPHMDKKI